MITSVASALGEERYTLRYVDGSQDFFKGANFSEFDAAERSGKLHIQMCKGFIDKAEPILIKRGDDVDLERLDLDGNCRDKRHEA